jgi:hypothetical protein
VEDADETRPRGGKLITREQYVELLVDASMREADELEAGFAAWCELNVPRWHEMGRDETWIRQRIESAQSTRRLHDTLKEQGVSLVA